MKFSFLFKRLVSVLLGLLFCCFVYLVLALIGSLIPVGDATQENAQEVKIFVQSNGMHTDLVLPLQNEVRNWLTNLDSTFLEKYPFHLYIAFGWGDADFYIGSKTQVSIFETFKALFLPSNTLIQAKFYVQAPSTHSRRVALWLSKSQYQRLCQYIENQFTKSVQGKFILLSQGYSAHDYFFEAQGSYHLFNTCNHWTSQGLKRAGIRNALWTPFDWGVFWHLR